MSDPVRLQIAFLTGRSDVGTCALSPQQEAFLTQLAAPGRLLVRRNFPYDADVRPWRSTPLWRASLSNLRDYFTSRSERFRARHAPALLALLARAPRTLFLTGSCGLEILLNLRLSPADAERVRVFAYGPVARRRPEVASLLVRGSRDWISRLFAPRADHAAGASHLDYLADPEVLALCKRWVAEVET